jgi:hypothetical protein
MVRPHPMTPAVRRSPHAELDSQTHRALRFGGRGRGGAAAVAERGKLVPTMTPVRRFKIWVEIHHRGGRG